MWLMPGKLTVLSAPWTVERFAVMLFHQEIKASPVIRKLFEEISNRCKLHSVLHRLSHGGNNKSLLLCGRLDNKEG